MVVNNFSEERNKILKIYFDTTFMLDVDSGKTLPCYLIEEIKKKKWEYYVSIFCMMEIFDIKQEHFFFHKKVNVGEPLKHILSKRRERDLSNSDLTEVESKLTNKLFKPHKISYGFFFDDEKSWKKCLEITRETNINSSDVIHLVTALVADCDILLTSDNFFIKEGNEYLKDKIPKSKLVLCSPENWDIILKEKGVN